MNETDPPVAGGVPGRTVALESTLITHGFAYPDNLSAARDSEQAVRDAGAVPATIAVIKGQMFVGVNDAQLEMLASPDLPKIKASTRDLPLCLAKKQTAGTTVAATMRIAAMAGIEIFATGGIGGVHRSVGGGAGDSWDISADLTELARTPVCVVCAGAKSLLDLPKTLEMLETLGIPVIGYRSDEFPAFYSRSSGLKIDARADTPQEVAAAWRIHRDLGLPGGMLVVNPLPESLALPSDEMEGHIQAALTLAESKGITGKAVTPFLLSHIAGATGGRTIAPNKALIRANAFLAGEIAVALAAA